MLRQWMRIKLWALIFLMGGYVGLCWGTSEASVRFGVDSASVGELMDKTIAEHDLVGMIAGGGEWEGCESGGERSGVRQVGSGVGMGIDDLVHLGSCTKAMTSVMLGTLVEEGRLSWDSELIDVLPELRGEIHERFYEVTLWELVSHRSGIRGNAKNWRDFKDLEIKKRRLALLKVNLKERGAAKRGEYLYSNLAYMVAGCMAERVTGKSWEVLMRERVFEKLGMKSAGFGVVGEKGKIDEPWGHGREKGEWVAIQGDNAGALGPAGTVHCRIDDWMKFLAIWLPW